MTALWLGLALAGGFTHRTSREPLPARWVERPLVLPAGWKEVSLLLDPSGLGGRGRLSLGSAVELRAAGWTDPAQRARVGAALTLGRAEAPARSAALTLEWEVPALQAVAPAHRVAVGLPLRRQWGGSRWTAGPVLDVDQDGVGRMGAAGEVGLQAGPLGGVLDGAFASDGRGIVARWSAGGFVQLNRAVRIHGSRISDDGTRWVAALELSL